MDQDHQSQKTNRSNQQMYLREMITVRKLVYPVSSGILSD